MTDSKKGFLKRFTASLFEDVKEPAPRPPSRGGAAQPPVEERKGAEPIGWDDPRPKRELAEPMGWDAPLPKGAKKEEEPPVRSFVKPPFEQRLRELVASGAAAGIAQLQLVGLESLREELGERWTTAAQRARDLLNQTIAKRIGDDDVYIQMDDDRFVVLFPNLTAEQASFKAQAILMEVRERLMGEFGIKDATWARAIVGDLAELNLHETLVTLGDLDAALKAKAKEREAKEKAIEPEEEPPPGMVAPEIERSKQAVKLEEELRDRIRPGVEPKGSAGKLQLVGLRAVKEELGPRWAEVADRARDIAEHVISNRIAPTDVMAPFDEDSFVILFAELDEEEALLRAAALAREIRERLLGELKLDRPPEVTARAAALARVVADVDLGLGGDLLIEIDDFLALTEDVAPPVDAMDADVRDELGEVRAVYRPTWFVPRGLVTIYDARPLRLMRDGSILRGAAAYPGETRPQVLFEVDRAVLTQAISDLRRLVEEGGKAVVQAPVHVITLLAHSRGQLVDLIRSAPLDARKYLVVELIAPDAPAPAAAIGEAAAAVKPFCRGVSARVGPEFPEIERLARLGLLSVGIDLDEDPDAEAPPFQFKTLQRFANRCRLAKLGAHLYGVTDTGLLAAAKAEGFTYLNGSAVRKDEPRPSQVQEFKSRI